MTVREARVYFLLIQFFLQFDSRVYRTKMSAFVFQVLLPWQHQQLNETQLLSKIWLWL